MEQQILPPPSNPNKGKLHQPLPEELLPYKKKYEIKTNNIALELNETGRVGLISANNKLAVIEDDDVYALLEKYGTEDNIDLASLCETFNISITSLLKLLKSDKFKEHYAAAKKLRGSMLLKMSLEAASVPYEMLMEGVEINPLLVKAAQLKSNQCLAIAKITDQDLALPAQATAIQAAGTINIQVNSGIPVKDF